MSSLLTTATSSMRTARAQMCCTSSRPRCEAGRPHGAELDRFHKMICAPCCAGHYNPGNMTACGVYGAGFESDVQRSRCVACMFGYFSPTAGNMCRACASGTVSVPSRLDCVVEDSASSSSLVMILAAIFGSVVVVGGAVTLIMWWRRRAEQWEPMESARLWEQRFASSFV